MAEKNLHQFEQLFRELFKPLCGFAMKYLNDWDDARDLVHEVFVTVWEKLDTLPADVHYRSYLYTSVRNRCLNHIRDRKKTVLMDHIAEQQLPQENNTAMEASELDREIELAIQSLPEKCREVFLLSRQDGLKYSQISEKMGISLKTVEAQMSKALNVLREHLREFLSVLILMYGS